MPTATTPEGGVDALRTMVADAAGVSINPDVLEPTKGGEGPGGEEVELADGHSYRTRRIGGFTDVEFIRMAVDAGMVVCLYGPPGTGKTTLVEAALGSDRVITQEFSEGTQVEDLVGTYLPAPGSGWEWRDGSLVRALRDGKVWFGDDITQGDPRVQSRVFPALDSRRRLTLNECGGELVEAAPGFGAIIAYNPDAPGTTFSEALASRCAIHVYVGFDAPTARGLGISPELVAAAEQLNLAMEPLDPFAALAGGDDEEEEGTRGPVLASTTWAPQLRELLAFKAVEETFDRVTAARNLLSVCPEEARPSLHEALEAHFSGGVALDFLRVE